MAMSDSNDDSSTVSFSVSLSTDREGFLRRECVSCGREFKTEVDSSELTWALAAQCERAGLQVGMTTGSDDGPPPVLRCPFCGHEAPGTDMHTRETIDYMKRLVYREYVVPMLNRFTADLEKSFGRRGRSGGLFSISMEFKGSREIAPVRPMHGPDSPDMKIIQFLCCGKQIKVPEAWDVAACSYCGNKVLVV
jgi:DNA-directed RNA polymerase subunit RPC12/RpoP